MRRSQRWSSSTETLTLHSLKASAFRPDLEGLRGVAVAAVVLFHSGLSAFSGGFLGVDAFFVLSGFLITSLITREIFETTQFSFARFYARRIRRLLPAVVVVVLVTFVGLGLLMSSVVSRQEAWGDGIASLLSVANIRFIAVSTDYFAPVVEPSPFLQMWSLSVEEQFYLVWPALLVVAFTLLRRNRQLVALAVGVISLISLLLFLSGVLGLEATFYSLPTRAWELGLGAYIAIRGTRSNLSQTTALLLAAAAFIIPVFNADLVPGASVLTCVAVALIIAGGQRQTWGGRLLTSSPMRFLGKISYSLYLWHWPAIVLLAPKIGMPLAIGAALLAATASERFVEAPFRTGQFSVAPARRILAVGAVVLLSGVGLAAALRPELGGAIFIKPNGQGGEGIKIQPSIENLAADTPYKALGSCYSLRDESTPPPDGCVFGNPSGEFRIALVGDSYAAQWFPAFQRIAEDTGATLLVLAKTGCPQLLVPTRFTSTTAQYQTCAPYSERVRGQLEAFEPDLIVTAYGDFLLESDSERNLAHEADAMRSGILRLLSVAPVVYISPVPVQPIDPVSCLDTHRDDPRTCIADPKVPETYPHAERDQIALSGLEAYAVDPQSLFCTGGTCPLVDSTGIVRNRDAKHVSATYSAAVWERVLRLLGESGAPTP